MYEISKSRGGETGNLLDPLIRKIADIISSNSLPLFEIVRFCPVLLYLQNDMNSTCKIFNLIVLFLVSLVSFLVR